MSSRGQSRPHAAREKAIADRSVAQIQKENADNAKRALDQLAADAEGGRNIFPVLLKAVEDCSLGQITGRLHEVVGRFRPMV